jgi:inosine/xanthosine triphosphate pyrophosphatase family protein
MGFALIVLATENDHKLKEFRSLWKWKRPLVSLTEARFCHKMPDETYLSYEGNAVQKAEFVGARLNMVVMGGRWRRPHLLWQRQSKGRRI